MIWSIMMPVDPSTLATLPDVVGAGRLAPYLAACGMDTAEAIRLYSWNIEASSAFLGAYAALEVGVRNAMHDQMTTRFQRSDWWAVAPLNAAQRDEIATATSFLNQRKTGGWTAGHVVAELKNSFWEGLLVNRYHSSLWVPTLAHAFPNFSGRRGDLRGRLERLRLVRNRAAHHEPIHERTLQIDHQYMCEIASYISADLATWVTSHSRLPGAIAGRALTVAGQRPTRF